MASEQGSVRNKYQRLQAFILLCSFWKTCHCLEEIQGRRPRSHTSVSSRTILSKELPVKILPCMHTAYDRRIANLKIRGQRAPQALKPGLDVLQDELLSAISDGGGWPLVAQSIMQLCSRTPAHNMRHELHESWHFTRLPAAP